MLWYVRVQHVIMKPSSVTGWFGQVHLTEGVNEKIYIYVMLSWEHKLRDIKQ